MDTNTTMKNLNKEPVSMNRTTFIIAVIFLLLVAGGCSPEGSSEPTSTSTPTETTTTTLPSSTTTTAPEATTTTEPPATTTTTAFVTIDPADPNIDPAVEAIRSQGHEVVLAFIEAATQLPYDRAPLDISSPFAGAAADYLQFYNEASMSPPWADKCIERKGCYPHDYGEQQIKNTYLQRVDFDATRSIVTPVGSNDYPDVYADPNNPNTYWTWGMYDGVNLDHNAATTMTDFKFQYEPSAPAGQQVKLVDFVWWDNADVQSSYRGYWLSNLVTNNNIEAVVVTSGTENIDISNISWIIQPMETSAVNLRVLFDVTSTVETRTDIPDDVSRGTDGVGTTTPTFTGPDSDSIQDLIDLVLEGNDNPAAIMTYHKGWVEGNGDTYPVTARMEVYPSEAFERRSNTLHIGEDVLLITFGPWQTTDGSQLYCDQRRITESWSPASCFKPDEQ